MYRFLWSARRCMSAWGYTPANTIQEEDKPQFLGKRFHRIFWNSTQALSRELGKSTGTCDSDKSLHGALQQAHTQKGFEVSDNPLSHWYFFHPDNKSMSRCFALVQKYWLYLVDSFWECFAYRRLRPVPGFWHQLSWDLRRSLPQNRLKHMPLSTCMLSVQLDNLFWRTATGLFPLWWKTMSDLIVPVSIAFQKTTHEYFLLLILA